MTPASVEHIELPVVIAEDELVDGLRSVDNLIDEGLAEGILVGAFWLVADGNANTAYFALVDIIASKEKIELVVGLDDGWCPQRPFQPGDVGLGDDVLVLRPVDEVFAGEGIEVELLVIGSAVGGKYPLFTVEDCALRVGIPPLEYGIATGLFLLSVGSANNAS